MYTSINEYISSQREFDTINEMNAFQKIIGITALLAASLTSCKKSYDIDTISPVTSIHAVPVKGKNGNVNVIGKDDIKFSNPLDLSLKGNWKPIDECRIDLKESFKITETTFEWSVTAGALSTHYGTGTLTSIYHNFDKVKPDDLSELKNMLDTADGYKLQQNYKINFYRIKGNKIYLYSRILSDKIIPLTESIPDFDGELMPGLKPTYVFSLYVEKETDNLIFDDKWRYVRN